MRFLLSSEFKTNEEIMNAKEFLIQKYPEMDENWNKHEVIDDNWVAAMMEEYAEAKAGQHETIVIGKKDLHTMRQWFNCIEDVHPKYLEKRDYELVKRVYEALNLPVREGLIEKYQ